MEHQGLQATFMPYMDTPIFRHTHIYLRTHTFRPQWRQILRFHTNSAGDLGHSEGTLLPQCSGPTKLSEQNTDCTEFTGTPKNYQ